MARFFLPSLVATALLVSGFSALAQPAGKRPATEVFTTLVEEKDFADRIEALGTLRANESVVISATVTETITAIHFDDGQRVTTGDVLVEMTGKEEHALLKEARSTLSEARKQYKRAEELIESRAISEAVLDQRKRDFETAKARLEGIKSRLQDRLIEAPFDGVVGIRMISKGALVSPGDAITRLYDDSVMKLDFSIPSTFLTSLSEGAAIMATSPAFPGMEFYGTISSIDAEINPVTRSILIRAILPNVDRILKPGLLMSVEVLKNPRKAIVIPEEAIQMQGRTHFVYQVNQNDDGHYVVDKREVTIGSRRPGEVEITQGLDVGAQLITHGALKVKDGSQVMVKAVEAGDQPLKELLEQHQAAGDTP